MDLPRPEIAPPVSLQLPPRTATPAYPRLVPCPALPVPLSLSQCLLALLADLTSSTLLLPPAAITCLDTPSALLSASPPIIPRQALLPSTPRSTSHPPSAEQPLFSTPSCSLFLTGPYHIHLDAQAWRRIPLFLHNRNIFPFCNDSKSPPGLAQQNSTQKSSRTWFLLYAFASPSFPLFSPASWLSRRSGSLEAKRCSFNHRTPKAHPSTSRATRSLPIMAGTAGPDLNPSDLNIILSIFGMPSPATPPIPGSCASWRLLGVLGT